MAPQPQRSVGIADIRLFVVARNCVTNFRLRVVLRSWSGQNTHTRARNSGKTRRDGSAKNEGKLETSRSLDKF